ncbi:MAG: PAS domain S-box protein [Desulfatibacillum sp.]|nr:PAS domain S-box protein [Desulfatibacillum sp.]
MGQRPVFENKTILNINDSMGENSLKDAHSDERPGLGPLCSVEHLPMGYVEIDLADACIVGVNQLFCQLSGYSREELMRADISLKVLLLDRTALDSFLQGIGNTGGPTAMVPFAMTTKDGRQIASLLKVQAIIRDGKPCRIVGLITEDRLDGQGETELLWLKAAIRGSSDAVGMADPHSRHFYHNEAFTRMFGYSVYEMSSRHPQVLYCNQEQAREIFEAIGKGESWAGEVEMRTKAGKVITVSLQADGITNSEGRVIALIGHHADITERKMTIMQLAQSLAKHKDFIENAPIGMMITDLEGLVIYANRKLGEITGYKKEDWLNVNFFPLVYPEDLPIILRQRECAIRTLKSVEPYEVRMVSSSGDIRWLRTIPQVILEQGPDGGKRIVGFQNFLEDVTPTKIAIEEKIRLERQLVQSRKMEALGTMAGGIAHDFNNILYPIMGYAELIKDDLNEESITYKNVVEIEKSAHRAKDLVQQILSFSRPSEQEIVPVAIQTALEDVLKMVRAAFPSTIQIRRNICSRCRLVLADPTQVHQVLMNLCTNAYHAMLEKGGLLHVSLREVEIGKGKFPGSGPLPPGHYARVTIRDTGCGIPRDVLDRIFEPYFTTKVAGEGTGLGLATVHAIVEKLEGRITVDSEEGKGSVFDVFFPIVPGAIAAPCKQERGPVPKGRESVLLVDDEESILNMLAQMLHRLGYKVTCFRDSLTALSAFLQRPEAFDVVITDLTMPKMTGVSLAEQMLKVVPSLPIILCTGFSERITASEVEKVGIKAFLNKPAIFHDLGQTIRKVLGE